jgi:NADH-quinone oxidoreductase subunit N
MDLRLLYPELTIAAAALLLVPVAGWTRGAWRVLPTILAVAALAASTVFSVRMLGWPARETFGGTYLVDGLALAFKGVATLAGLVSVVLLGAAFREREPWAHAPVAVLFATLGAMVLASAVDLALIVLFLQMTSLASYLVVALVRRDPLANEAALKYFLYGATALGIMAYGLTFLFGMTGSLALREIGASLPVSNAWLVFALACVFAGYAFEAALVPFQFWAPDGYAGASAAGASFVSIVPKIAAFAGLARFVQLALPEEAAHLPTFVAMVSIATMTFGNLAALRQRRLKRLLAYSSIAQAGYVLLPLAVLERTATALPALVFYLAAYVFMNLGAFCVAAQLERASGTDAIEDLQGLGRTAPWTGGVLALSLLSLAGIPPLAGFAGKVLLLEAALAGHLAWLAVAAAVNMVLALYYYMAIVARLYFMQDAGKRPATGGGFGAVQAASLAGTIVLGVAPQSLLHLLALALAPAAVM